MNHKMQVQTTGLSKRSYITLLRRLLHWRVRYYAQLTADAVQRNRQSLLLLVCILGPMLLGLLFALAKPLMLLLEGKTLSQTLFIWLVFLTLSIFWVGLQKRPLMGGESFDYLARLPIAAAFITLVDLCVLCVLNSVLLLPYVMAIFYVLVNDLAVLHKLVQVSTILVWAISIVLLQLMWLRRSRFLYLSLLASFLSPLVMVLTQHLGYSIAISIAFCVVIFRQINLNQVMPALRHYDLPQFLRIQQHAHIYINLLRVYLRQIFQFNELAKRSLLLIPMFAACFVLPLVQAKLILQNFLWIHWQTEALVLWLAAFCLASIVHIVGEMTAVLNIHHLQQRQFLQLQGITLQQLYKGQQITIMSLLCFIACPSWLVIALYSNVFSTLLTIPAMILMVSIYIWMNRQPENVHAAAKLSLWLTTLLLTRLFLNIYDV